MGGGAVAIDVACPCGERYAVDDQLAGKLARCGVCGRNVPVPVFVPVPILTPAAKAGPGAWPEWRKNVTRAWLAIVALNVLIVFFGRDRDREDVLRVATAPFRCAATAFRWAFASPDPPRDPAAGGIEARFDVGDDGFIPVPRR